MNNLSSPFTIEDLREIAYRGSYRDSERALARELLALREAGKEPVGKFIHWDSGDDETGPEMEWVESTMPGAIPLYAAPQLPAVPEGWVMVPKQLTIEMRNAWDSAPYTDDDDEDMRGAYSRMIAAAPKPEPAVKK